jgi:hypothetical protein
VFFLFMLPPIILDAGYFMPNRSVVMLISMVKVKVKIKINVWFLR